MVWFKVVAWFVVLLFFIMFLICVSIFGLSLYVVFVLGVVDFSFLLVIATSFLGIVVNFLCICRALLRFRLLFY